MSRKNSFKPDKKVLLKTFSAVPEDTFKASRHPREAFFGKLVKPCETPNFDEELRSLGHGTFYIDPVFVVLIRLRPDTG